MTNEDILNLLKEINGYMAYFGEPSPLLLKSNSYMSFIELEERVLWDSEDYPQPLTVDDLKKQLIEEFTIVAKEVDHILKALKK